MQCSPGFDIWALTVPYLRHVSCHALCHDMPQALNSNWFLYAANSYHLFQLKDVEEIEKVWSNNFENICDWFVDNKLHIRFNEAKTKSILLGSQRKIKNIKKNLIKSIGQEMKKKTESKNNSSRLCYGWNYACRTYGCKKLINKMENWSFFTETMVF